MARKPSMGADRARAGRVALSVPSTFAQYKTLLAKDLQQEFRTKEMLTSMGIYALLVLIVYGAALGQTAQATDVLQLSGGLLWALIVFTSLLGLNRSFNHEKEQGCMEGILLVPMDRSVIFLAKATSNLLFLLVVEVIAVPLFWFFFLTTAQPGPGFMLMAVPLAVGTIGVAGIGTLLSTITVNTRGKDVMLAVLFVPLIFPLLYACASATTAVVVGADRIAANGDVANKIGTYGLAVLAHHHGIPFYVAAPASTVDAACATGADIPIEERDSAEVLPRPIEGVDVWNPAFDVTPADLVTRVITEQGTFPPSEVARCVQEGAGE